MINTLNINQTGHCHHKHPHGRCMLLSSPPLKKQHVHFFIFVQTESYNYTCWPTWHHYIEGLIYVCVETLVAIVNDC